MKISDYQQFELEFNCQEVEELLFLYVLDRGDLSLDEIWAIERHLEICIDCQKEHEQSKFVNDALIANRDYLNHKGVFGEPKPETKSKQITDEDADFQQFQAKIHRAIAKRKKSEHQSKPINSRFAIKTASAIAACLIAALGMYLTVNYLTGKGGITPNLASNPSENSVKIELLTGSESKIILAGQPIIALNGHKTLRINGNRHMILNTGTELSIIPHNLGCIVKLSKGEIFADVQHDGKPFIVISAHGRAIITGTTFNIKADDKQMELAVAEGTVSFEGENGKVNVTADYKSTLALNTMPTMPQPCDTAKLTAWATGLEPSQDFAAKKSEIELSSVFDSRQIDLQRINYTSWIEEKRDWFKREFPQIFKFKEALAKEGIEADYPQLLIKSGDLWRFAFPEKTNTQFVPANYESMVKLAAAYKKDEKWLSDNLSFSRANLISQNETLGIKALDRWAYAIEETLNSQSEMSIVLLTYSLHASVYLSETRTLAWLAINSDQIALTVIDKQKAVKVLEQEITLASNCVIQFKNMFLSTSLSSACDDDKVRRSQQSVIESIEEMMQIEKMIINKNFN